MKTIDKIITNVSTKFGAPMGRHNAGTKPHVITSGNSGRIAKCNQITVFDCSVPLIDGYDKGGVYWGIGEDLRVSYTKDLSYIEFYRGSKRKETRY